MTTGTILEADEMALVEEEMAWAQAPVASSSRVRVEDLESDTSGANLTSGSGMSATQETRSEFRSSATAERPRPPRSPSPVWDIELDLNDSPPTEIDEPMDSNADDRPSKKLKTAHTFGKPDSNLLED